MSKVLETIMFLIMFTALMWVFLFGAAIVEEQQRIQEADQEFSGMIERGIEALDLDYIYEEAQDE